MEDRRALLPLMLLLACAALTACGLVGGETGGQTRTVATSSEPGEPGVSQEEAVRPLRKGRGVTPGETGTPGGPFPLPLPLMLTIGGGVAVAGAGGLYLWSRGRRTAAATPSPAPPWQTAPQAPQTPQMPLTPQAPPGTMAAEAPPHPWAPDRDPLAEALTEVAGSGISQALTQQVERLFSGGHPGRETLVEACIGYRDQIAERHPRLADTLGDGLNRAGVREIVPDGQRFDPRLHEAFGSEPTDRPELHDTVAETVKRGYADGGRVIRVPQVAVYRHPAPGGEGVG
ncbi:nucleotide exchange factor GrpE [Streptosporangium sp. NPDC020145]|uniref:nucleotide exchange factor GrpE n=1 Tax=Streptosporangium sp. NPDC020145 TaxID=3154694 RepID=UPI00342F7D96